MGLKSDKHGVKAELKLRYKQAFKEFPSLVEARDASLATREEAFSVIDGNVIFFSIPQTARSLDAYIAILTTILKKAIATSAVTAVVFDDPECLTKAKQQEQQRRDAARAATSVMCSSDLFSDSPKDDNYDTKDMEKVQNVHDLVQNRNTRLRFFDEVAMRVLQNLKSQIERWNQSGFKGGHIVFDGIDPRGGDRALGNARKAMMVGSSDEIVRLFDREIQIGEGDLKLADLGRRVRSLALQEDPNFEKTKLCLTTTIDTDSLAIELIEEAKRCKEIEKPSKPFNILLCMRERARKRGMDDDKESFYLCCDISLLQALLQQHMWSVHRSPSAEDKHAAMTLMCAGWGMCGCDFLELKGMRSDAVFDSMPIVVKTIPSALDAIKGAFTGKRDDVIKIHEALRALTTTCASKLEDIPRIKKETISAIRNPDDIILRRASWLSCYWNSIEHRGDMSDFGFFLPTSHDVVFK